ncbi:MAG: hypothetical protein K2X87_07835 [Gemmataceae bacterium]|nr:hypothetical protein [Gemmataceae bacterium]
MLRAVVRRVLPYRVRAAVRGLVGPSRRSLVDRNAGLAADLARSAAEADQLRAARREAESEVGRLRGIHQSAAGEIARLRGELGAVGSEAGRLRAAVTAAEADAVRLRDELAAAAADSDRTKAELAAEADRFRVEIDRRAAAEAEAHAEVGRLREAEQNARAEADRLDALYLCSRAGLTTPAGVKSDDELLAALRAVGVPATAADRVILHVGFGHAATTSLQHGFFGKRDDLHYLGLPYADAGGFFSSLKYADDDHVPPADMLGWCRDLMYGHPDRGGRPIVVSDEMFAETAEVYYAPRHLPPAVVAARLKRYFPAAKVVFTVRRQPDYVTSLYFNLRRNYAYLAGMPMPPFAEWWWGTHTQVCHPYLQNVDYAPLVRTYCELFGREDVLVLPLEALKAGGPAAYLGRLGAFADLPIGDTDVERFRKPHNARMSVVEDRVADLLAARHTAADVRKVLENPALAELMPQSAPATLDLGDEVRRDIHGRAAAGNRWLAAEFGLPLADWGYPV